MVTKELVKLVGTGNPEIDEKLDGGIALGSLILLEGAADAGKSVFAQHFTHEALRSGLSVAHYSTQKSIKDLMSQMVSLDLDVTDYFLCDRLRAYPISRSQDADSGVALNSLLGHFESLPIEIKLIAVDALTDLIGRGDQRQTVDFFAACKRLCDLGRTITLVMQPDADSDSLLERVRAICDTHLVLRMEQQDGRWDRMMEAVKLDGAAPGDERLVHFNVEPGSGLKVVSLISSRR